VSHLRSTHDVRSYPLRCEDNDIRGTACDRRVVFWALLLALFGIWIAMPFNNLFFVGLGLYVAIAGDGKLLSQAAEAYASARPEPRSDQRQRYLKSRYIYSAGKRDAESKRGSPER
jgi:hypothetical protein